MRIGFDARLVNETGVGRYIKNLLINLAKINKHDEFLVFTGSRELKYLPNLPSSFIKIALDVRWHSLTEQLWLPFILGKYKLDLVHFPYFSLPVFYQGRFVVTVHDLIIDHETTGRASRWPYPVYMLKKSAYRMLMRRALSKAEHVFAISEATAGEIKVHYGEARDKISVTYDALDENFLKTLNNAENTSVYLPRGKPYLIYVGNAYPHKNLERFIDAFGEIRREFPSLTFVVVGKDDYFILRLKEYVRHKGLATSVVFTGFVSDVDLFLLYQRARAFVFPSLYEGFGLPPLEAMKIGTPVITTMAGSLPEVCGSAARYISSTDPEELARAMEEMFDEKTNKDYIEKGRSWSEKFTWKKTVEEILNVFKSV